MAKKKFDVSVPALRGRWDEMMQADGDRPALVEFARRGLFRDGLALPDRDAEDVLLAIKAIRASLQKIVDRCGR